jgi:hypothetical protein
MGISASNSGIEIEENGNITSYIKLASTRDSFNIKVPTDNTIYNMVLKDASGNSKFAGTLDISGNNNISGNVDISGSIIIRTLLNDATPSNIVFYNTTSKAMSYGPVPSTITLGGSNTWTGPNQFNSTLTTNGITTLNGQSTGTSITSPSVVVSLGDWKNQVNSWSQGNIIVQYNPKW